jgi:aspartokinase-like uncharacterized kinase
MCRVVKLGGSLLRYDGLVGALRDWLSRQSPACHVLIPGGGMFADGVRELDARFALDPAHAHWLCVRLMDATARTLSLMLGNAVFCDRFEKLQRLVRNVETELVVYSTEEFLQQHEPRQPGQRLPLNWSVTSDSIAARLAVALPADELVLLKSSDSPAASDLEGAVQAGYVDAFFPRVASSCAAVRCVNLVAGRETTLLAAAPARRPHAT